MCACVLVSVPVCARMHMPEGVFQVHCLEKNVKGTQDGKLQRRLSTLFPGK